MEKKRKEKEQGLMIRKKGKGRRNNKSVKGKRKRGIMVEESFER